MPVNYFFNNSWECLELFSRFDDLRIKCSIFSFLFHSYWLNDSHSLMRLCSIQKPSTFSLNQSWKRERTFTFYHHGCSKKEIKKKCEKIWEIAKRSYSHFCGLLDDECFNDGVFELYSEKDTPPNRRKRDETNDLTLSSNTRMRTQYIEYDSYRIIVHKVRDLILTVRRIKTPFYEFTSMK